MLDMSQTSTVRGEEEGGRGGREGGRGEEGEEQKCSRVWWQC